MTASNTLQGDRKDYFYVFNQGVSPPFMRGGQRITTQGLNAGCLWQECLYL